MSDRQKQIEAVIRPQVRFGKLLAILFIALKLTDQIGWSWLWVLAPLWVPWAIIGMLLLLAGALWLVLQVSEARLRRTRRRALERRRQESVIDRDALAGYVEKERR